MASTTPSGSKRKEESIRSSSPASLSKKKKCSYSSDKCLFCQGNTSGELRISSDDVFTIATSIKLYSVEKFKVVTSAAKGTMNIVMNSGNKWKHSNNKRTLGKLCSSQPMHICVCDPVLLLKTLNVYTYLID